MKSGIYSITNTVNNKIYIGQSKNIKARINRHKSELKHNKHKNLYLQRECNKYGFDFLKFEVLEFCEETELNFKERYYIEKFETNNYKKGLNLTNGGENTKWTKEAREKRCGSGNPMYGKNISKEHLEIVRVSNLGTSDKLTVEDVVIIKTKLSENYNLQKLAEEYQVSYSTIHKIFCCKNWYWVLSELNESLKKLREKNRCEKELEIKKRNEKIIQAFCQGKKRKDICEIYCLSKDVVGDVLKNYQANTEVNLKCKSFKSL